MEEVLARHAPDLSPPRLRLPCAAVFGRRDGLAVAGRRVAVEMLKEGLFRDPEFFRATRQDGGLLVEAQLRAGRRPTSGLDDRLVAALGGALLPGLGVAVQLYERATFPQPVTHERKHRYFG
jgi:hypothetical protein